MQKGRAKTMDSKQNQRYQLHSGSNRFPLYFPLIFFDLLNFLDFIYIWRFLFCFYYFKNYSYLFYIFWSNPSTFIEMSLSTMRTPNMRLSLDHMENSPRGTRFLLPIPNTKPELEGHRCWPVDFKDDFTFYLKRSKNRSILTGIKREDY